MVKKAVAINEKSRNTCWQYAIEREIENVSVAFQTILESGKAPIAYQYVDGHIVIDIKMEDFCRKACLVAGGYMTHTLDVIIYFNLVTREFVCIAFTVAALHDLEVKAANVLNAFVMASNREKRLTVVGPEFGDGAGKSVIIVRVLLGLKSAGALFRAHLVQCTQSSGTSHMMLILTCG